jgi:tRNA A-37 threonylcarbamoyl transferase component Bud32
MNCESCGHNNIEGARFCANCGITLPTQTDDENKLVGKLVGGRYRITRVIGEGGMGIVYEAEQKLGSSVRKVAVKTLHTELSRDPSVTARFHRECGTVAGLDHPNTIKVYDFGAMEDGTLYIAMEYLAGKPLDRVIQEEKQIAPQRVLRLLRQVAGSLEEAHRQGIIHRDLKPENVILVERAGEKDVVKLLDFGIAARTESADAAREAKLTQQGMVLGTPPYMSPEQFTGKALDKRSDIYSLAVMAYEMLTGTLPFEATTPWQWATEHMTAQPRPFETLNLAAPIPEPMRRAILRALSKDPNDRFSGANEFVDALAEPEISESRPKVRTAEAVMATAAMTAAPDFGAKAAPAPTAAMPAQSSHQGYGTGPSGVAVPAAPTTSAREAPKNKGLLIGLGVAAAGLIGVLVVAMGGGGGSDDSQGVLNIPTTPTAKPVVVDEQKPDPGGNDEPAQPEESAAEEQTPSPSPQPAAGASPRPNPNPTPGTAPKPRPNPTAAPAPGPAPAPSPGPAPAANDACDQCIAAAGNYSAAIPKLNQCTDPAKKASCQKRIQASATRTGIAAANKGDCSTANRVVSALQAAGMSSAQLSSAAAKCK